MGVSDEIEALPYIDEHALLIGAGPETAWTALQAVVERTFSTGMTPRLAHLLGCEDENGFHVARAEPGRQLALAGRHRFSRYALVFHLDAAGEGTRLRAETRAEFPALKGAAYRALVIGTRGHVLVTRRILDAVKRRAERPAAPDRPLSGVLELTPGESVEILRAEPDRLEVRGVYAAGGKPPPKHYHPSQSERIEVTAGTLRTVVDGVERTLAAGDSIEVPPGAVHAIWTDSGEATETLWSTIPAGRTEQWFRALDAIRREGRVGKDGMPGPLAFGVYLTEYRDVFRLAGPDWLLRPALAALGLLGRARGYRP